MMGAMNANIVQAISCFFAFSGFLKPALFV
jgi:hypothetical protein